MSITAANDIVPMSNNASRFEPIGDSMSEIIRSQSYENQTQSTSGLNGTSQSSIDISRKGDKKAPPKTKPKPTTPLLTKLADSSPSSVSSSTSFTTASSNFATESCTLETPSFTSVSDLQGPADRHNLKELEDDVFSLPGGDNRKLNVVFESNSTTSNAPMLVDHTAFTNIRKTSFGKPPPPVSRPRKITTAHSTSESRSDSSNSLNSVITSPPVDAESSPNVIQTSEHVPFGSHALSEFDKQRPKMTSSSSSALPPAHRQPKVEVKVEGETGGREEPLESTSADESFPAKAAADKLVDEKLDINHSLMRDEKLVTGILTSSEHCTVTCDSVSTTADVPVRNVPSIVTNVRQTPFSSSSPPVTRPRKSALTSPQTSTIPDVCQIRSDLNTAGSKDLSSSKSESKDTLIGSSRSLEFREQEPQSTSTSTCLQTSNKLVGQTERSVTSDKPSVVASQGDGSLDIRPQVVRRHSLTADAQEAARSGGWNSEVAQPQESYDDNRKRISRSSEPPPLRPPPAVSQSSLTNLNVSAEEIQSIAERRSYFKRLTQMEMTKPVVPGAVSRDRGNAMQSNGSMALTHKEPPPRPPVRRTTAAETTSTIDLTTSRKTVLQNSQLKISTEIDDSTSLTGLSKPKSTDDLAENQNSDRSDQIQLKEEHEQMTTSQVKALPSSPLLRQDRLTNSTAADVSGSDVPETGDAFEKIECEVDHRRQAPTVPAKLRSEKILSSSLRPKSIYPSMLIEPDDRNWTSELCLASSSTEFKTQPSMSLVDDCRSHASPNCLTSQNSDRSASGTCIADCDAASESVAATRENVTLAGDSTRDSDSVQSHRDIQAADLRRKADDDVKANFNRPVSRKSGIRYSKFIRDNFTLFDENVGDKIPSNTVAAGSDSNQNSATKSQPDESKTDDKPLQGDPLNDSTLSHDKPEIVNCKPNANVAQTANQNDRPPVSRLPVSRKSFIAYTEFISESFTFLDELSDEKDATFSGSAAADDNDVGLNLSTKSLPSAKKSKVESTAADVNANNVPSLDLERADNSNNRQLTSDSAASNPLHEKIDRYKRMSETRLEALAAVSSAFSFLELGDMA